MKPITTSAEVQAEQNKSIVPLNPIQAVSEKLTEEESLLYESCRKTAKEGMRTYLKVGAALQVILEGRLYREKYETFEHFLEEEFDFSRQHGYYLIEAAKIGNRVSDVSDIPSARAATELGKYPEEKQREIAKDLPPNPKGKDVRNTASKQNNPPKPKTKVNVEPPKPSPSKAEKEHLSKIAALEAQLETLQRGSMFANKIRSDIANLKAAAANVSEAEIVAPPEDDARRDEDPLPFHAPSQKQALLDEMALVLQAFLHPNSSHNPGTVRALVSRFIELVNKHF